MSVILSLFNKTGDTDGVDAGDVAVDDIIDDDGDIGAPLVMGDFAMTDSTRYNAIITHIKRVL